MKATLTFNLPDEGRDYNLAIRGEEYYMCLENFRQYLRREIKYNEQLSDIERDTFERIREEFNGILTENGIEL